MSYHQFPNQSSSPYSLFPMSISGIQGQLLEVTVVGCNKLKDTEWISRQDPYVCVEYANSKFRTRTHTAHVDMDGVDGGKNPTFQEKFVIPLIEGLRVINVYVWNSNSITYDDFIGEGKIQLQKVLDQGYDDATWPLQTKTGRYAGEVRLIMHYTKPNASAKPNKPAAGYAPSAPPYGAPPPASAYAPPQMYAPPPPAACPAPSPYPSYSSNPSYPPNPAPAGYPPNPAPGGYPPNPAPGGYPPNPAPGGYPPSPYSAPPPAAYPPAPYPPSSTYPPPPSSTYPPPPQGSSFYPPPQGPYGIYPPPPY
ncbi:U1 small nuclear ribonucleoprotein C isoform X2 [Argentina anserina]|uniref:U1 small nuclear ribonucleoprotein C isoform X2 n=1 Tax=Argentina anserina TaxID=57926 RepID=UPI0021768F3A|nr:U1 small nuclear ribonucleoprotein C isoform X2 [Potentilla anserina]